MEITGGCYCGEIRYKAEGEPMFAGQCHCRECQYITGGNPNVIMAMPESGFSYTQGEPKTFSRSDIENAVTRHFCPNCGTAIGTQSKGLPGAMILKVGTMDDPSVFEPQVAIFTVDKQKFHHIPEGMPAFERVPG
ncbi:MAG: GFA family protein [Pseudomonadales bacterium]|nr:GFA family protein [Pseudomonadales bacterium]